MTEYRKARSRIFIQIARAGYGSLHEAAASSALTIPTPTLRSSQISRRVTDFIPTRSRALPRIRRERSTREPVEVFTASIRKREA